MVIKKLAQEYIRTKRGKTEMRAVIAVMCLAKSIILVFVVVIPVHVITISKHVRIAVIKGAKFALPKGTNENDE